MLKLLAKLRSLFWLAGHGDASTVQAAPLPSQAPARPASPQVTFPRIPSASQTIPNGPFTLSIILAAKDAADDYGGYIWPSVTLAQWALESNFGKSMPTGSNNPFGIKAVAGQPSVSSMTTEHLNGKDVRMTQSFRKFGSLAIAFSAHNRLLATSHYYAKARAAKSAEEFAHALTGVYATDPHYGEKLISIMHKYELNQYD
jgi:flagellum-specific peptidoglycan hydrolase FlgJ